MDYGSCPDNVDNEENTIVYMAMDAGFQASDVCFIDNMEGLSDVPASCKVLCVRNLSDDIVESAKTVLGFEHIETCVFMLDRMMSAFTLVRGHMREVDSIPRCKNDHCSVKKTVHDIVVVANEMNGDPYTLQALIHDGFKLYLEGHTGNNPIARILRNNLPKKEQLPLIFLNSLDAVCEIESECIDYFKDFIELLPDKGIVTIARSCDASNMHAFKELFPDRPFVICPQPDGSIDTGLLYSKMTSMDVTTVEGQFRYGARCLSSSVVVLLDTMNMDAFDLAKDIVHGYRTLTPDGVMVVCIPSDMLTLDEFADARRHVFENTKIRAVVSKNLEYQFGVEAILILSPKDLYGGKTCMNLTFDRDFSLPLHELTYGPRKERIHTVLVNSDRLDRRWCLEDTMYSPVPLTELGNVMPFEDLGIDLKTVFGMGSMFGVEYADEEFFKDEGCIPHKVPISKCRGHIVKGSCILLGHNGTRFTFRGGGGQIVPKKGVLFSRFREDDLPSDYVGEEKSFEKLQIWRTYVLYRYIIPFANRMFSEKGCVPVEELNSIMVPMASIAHTDHFRSRSLVRGEEEYVPFRIGDFQFGSEDCLSFRAETDKFNDCLGVIHKAMMGLGADRLYEWGFLMEQLRAMEDLKLTYVRAFMDYLGMELNGAGEEEKFNILNVKKRLEKERDNWMND